MADPTPTSAPVRAYGEDDEAKALAKPVKGVPAVGPTSAVAGTTETDVAANQAAAVARAKQVT